MRDLCLEVRHERRRGRLGRLEQLRPALGANRIGVPPVQRSSWLVPNSMNRGERHADQRRVEARIRRQQVDPFIDPQLVTSDIEQHLASSRAYRPGKSDCPCRQDGLLVRNVGGSISRQLSYDQILDREWAFLGEQPPDAALLAPRGNHHVLDRGATAVRPSDGFRVIGQHGGTIPYGSEVAIPRGIVKVLAKLSL
jgi:hypothetical protein